MTIAGKSTMTESMLHFLLSSMVTCQFFKFFSALKLKMEPVAQY